MRPLQIILLFCYFIYIQFDMFTSSQFHNTDYLDLWQITCVISFTLNDLRFFIQRALKINGLPSNTTT